MIVYSDPHPASPASIVVAEAILGLSLPRAFRAHLITVSNGGYIVPVTVRGFDFIGVEGVIGVGRSDSLDLSRMATWLDDVVSYGMLPVAFCACGTFLVADLENGSIWFYDNEYEVDDPEALTRVAHGWDELLALTYEPPPITVKPESEKPGWIDPEFLRQIRSGEIT